LSKNTFKYYQSDDKDKPTDKTITLYVEAKQLNQQQFGILFKSLRKYYISSSLGSDYYHSDKEEAREAIRDEILRNKMKNIQAIDEKKINKNEHDFNEHRAYQRLKKFKTRMIILIQLSFACLIYYFSQNLILVIASTVAIELVVSVMNKKPSKKDFEKAAEEMERVRNRL